MWFYGKWKVSSLTSGRCGGGAEHVADVGGESERILGDWGCSDWATHARASAAPVSDSPPFPLSCSSSVSFLLLPASSGAVAAPTLAPPSPVPFPDCSAAAFSSTVSNGLGAAPLGLCRSHRGAGAGAAGRCIQGPGWMMVSHGWLSRRLELEVAGQRHKMLTCNQPSTA